VPSLRDAEVEFFRFLNRWVEPRVRAGLGSPRLVPGGLIVLETRGRRTGRRARVPLVATRFGDHVVVGTFRGGRSQWTRNLEARPETRFWMGGRARPARATVIRAGRAPRRGALPPLLRVVAALLAPYTRAGWTFAVLAPRRLSEKRTAARAAERGRPPCP
jgi:deazaflavin-dependent oxidoreductase (nitroreductase family)